MPMPGTEIDTYAVQVGGWEEETEFFDMLIHSSIGNHYDSVGLGSLRATAQSESYLKVLKI